MRRCLIISAIMLVLLFVLLIEAPIMLAPPHFFNSEWLYIGMVLLWLPITTVCLLFNHLKNRRNKPKKKRDDERIWKTSLFVLMVVWGLCILASIPPFPFPAADGQCETISLDNGRVKYVCRLPSSVYSTYYELEGFEGIPLVWVIERDDR